MSFFDFNQTEILPYSKTNAARRDSRISENLKNLNEAMRNEKQINMYQEQAQADLLKEESAKNLVNGRTISRRRRIQEDIRLEKVLLTKTLSRYLSEMVISGLVFDEDYIERQKNLTSKVTAYVESMFANEVISASNFTDNGNLLMESAYYELTDLVKEKIRNRDTVDIFSEAVVDEILSEAKKAKETSEEVADAVKEKVKDTIKEEKKISKKKEEEKEDEEEMSKEISDAADSLDDDVDDDSSEIEDDEDDMSDDELDAMDKEIDDEDLEDGDEGLDDLGEDEPEDLESDGITNEEDADSDAEEDAEELDDATDSTEAESTTTEEPEVEADAEGTTDNTMEITIKTDGKNVSVNANQSESTAFLNLFGKSRYEERNSKSLFRNLLEGNITYASSMLAESNDSTGIKMDLVLAETITEYTLLETMFTSKIFNLSPSQLKSLMKTINFNRK